jgi:hypothetical protein
MKRKAFQLNGVYFVATLDAPPDFVFIHPDQIVKMLASTGGDYGMLDILKHEIETSR